MWKLLSATEINKLPLKNLGYYSTINNIITHCNNTNFFFLKILRQKNPKHVSINQTLYRYEVTRNKQTYRVDEISIGRIK